MRKPPELLRGLGLLAGLWAAALFAARLQLIFPRSILVWLSDSPDPQKALVAFAALVSSGILVLFRLGLEIPLVKSWISSDKVQNYIAGVPLWILVGICAVALGSLLLVFPACQPPTSVIFHIEGREDTYRPNQTLMADPGESLAIAVEPIEQDAILSCKWQYVGDVFETIGTRNGCDINLMLSDQSGNGLLTLQATRDFCNQSSVFSLGIQIIQP